MSAGLPDSAVRLSDQARSALEAKGQSKPYLAPSTPLSPLVSSTHLDDPLRERHCALILFGYY